MTRATLLFLSSFCLFFVVGCGGGGDGAAVAEESGEDGGEMAAMPEGSATISGTVHFDGTAPAPQPLNLDRECAGLHDDAVHSQHVVVNDNGTLKYVFVYVKEGLGDQTYPTPSEPVVLDQEGCMYEPHVFGLQTGQTLQILNSDPVLHNIHALPETNRPFNFGMPTQNSSREQSFRAEEVMVRIKCDVHPWMLSFAGVVDHPFHGVTGDDGTFSLSGLPAGTYVVEAWHEAYGTSTQNVTVGEGEAATVDFRFSGQAS